MTWLKENIMRLSKECSVVSFDNLALEQLDMKSMLPAEVWEECYMGDDGDYTFYMDLVAGTYSRNSVINERKPIGDHTVDEMFNDIRSDRHQ